MNINPALPGKVRQHRNGTADRLKAFREIHDLSSNLKNILSVQKVESLQFLKSLIIGHSYLMTNGADRLTNHHFDESSRINKRLIKFSSYDTSTRCRTLSVNANFQNDKQCQNQRVYCIEYMASVRYYLSERSHKTIEK